MPQRKHVSTRLRFEIFKRDGFACQYCGATPPRVVLHVDHINPVKLGGDNSPENLITACEKCNQGKSAVPLQSVPKSLSQKAKEVSEREAQIAGYAKVMDAARERLESDTWRVIEILSPGASEKGYSRANFDSVKRFVDKIGVFEAIDAAEITVTRFGRPSFGAFKYFCGICWAKARNSGDEH